MLENPFLYSLAITLVHFIWQGCLVALSLKILLTFVSPQKTQIRYTLATIAMLINLLLPIATFLVVYHVDLKELTNSHTMITTLVKNINFTNETDFSATFIEYLPFVSIAWLASISYLTVKLVFDVRFVNQLTKVGIISTEKQLTSRFMQLAQEMELTTMPRLLISLKAEIPMAVGWLKPVVLLPASMISGLSAMQLEMLILHELAHIKRHDYLVNFIQTVVEILLFFHPAVRWVSTQMRNEREFCSDDIAVHHCCKPIAYARTLTETAALCQKNAHNGNHSIPQMALAASGGDLKQRVIRIVDSHCTTNNDLGRWFASIFLFLSLLLISTRQFFTLPVLEENFTYLPFHSKQQPNFTQQSSNNERVDLSQTPIAQHLFNRNNDINDISKVSLSLDEASALKHQKYSTETSIIKPIFTEDKKFTRPDKFKVQLNKLRPTEVTKAKPIKTKPVIVLNQANEDNSAKHAFDRGNSIEQNLIEKKEKPAVKTVKNDTFTKKDDVDTDVFEKFKTPINPYSKQIEELSQSSTLSSSNLQAEISTTSETETKLVISKPAQLISSFSPKYPALAKRKKLELEVLVHFDVDTNGYISNIEFDQQGKTNYFRRSIKSALHKWRFEPAKVNGKAVESTMSKIFSFSLAN